MPSLQQLAQVVPAKFAVAKNLHEQPWSNRFAGMDRYDRSSPVGVLLEMVASTDPCHGKSRLAQCADQNTTGNSGQLSHR
jgi:hypothetical protein